MLKNEILNQTLTISYSWRSLVSYVCSVILRPERSLFYFLTIFEMVILVVETISRKSCCNSLKFLIMCDHKNPLFACKLHFRGFEKGMNWLAAIEIAKFTYLDVALYNFQHRRSRDKRTNLCFRKPFIVIILRVTYVNLKTGIFLEGRLCT